MFADGEEAYVLETAGTRHWAWERIGPGEHRNISNGISIRTKWGAVSKDLLAACKENGWWDGTSKFDWKRAVGTGGSPQGLESCGGREKAGFEHMKTMEAKSDAIMSAQSPRWWIEQMSEVLRDESSGICFRDIHGFCSTGSQISWLPTTGKVASHFFTGASDPLCGTPYKLFTFSNPMPHSSDKEDELNDNGTNRLWDLWRKKALARTTINAPLRDTLLEMEEDGVSQLLECTGNIPIKRQSTFAEMVQREIELLEN